MSYQAVKYVLQHSPIYGKARMVLMCLAEHTNIEGITWPGVDTIAAECRIRKSEVLNSLKVLLRSGEICVAEKGRPRSSAKYLMLRFLETPDVGAPTVKIIRGASEEIARNLTVPGMKTRVYSVPTVLQRELIAVPADTAGTESGSAFLIDKAEPSRGPKTPQWEPLGGPGVPDSVPTVSAGTGTKEPSGVPAPPLGGSGHPNHHSPAAAAPASSGGADGLAASSGNNNGWHSRYYELLESGLDPAAASAKLREEGLLPRAEERPALAIAGQGNRDIEALHSMREIIEHARRAAEGKEPFDFVDPQPQLVKPEGILK